MNNVGNKKWNKRVTVVHTTGRSMVAYHEGEPFYAFVEPFRDSRPVEVDCDYIQPLHMGLLKICQHLEPAKRPDKIPVSKDYVNTYLEESREFFTEHFPEGTYDFEPMSSDIASAINSLYDIHVRIDRQVGMPRKVVSGVVPDELIREIEKAYMDGHEVSGLIVTMKDSDN